jgi:T5SS/PEP-CTERM-associated repeat protein
LFVGGTQLLAALTVSGGATINATGATSVIDSLGSIVTDAGTALHTGFQFIVGNHNQGSLEVEAGDRVQADNILIVGANADGTVDVLTGGHVNAPQAILGFNPSGFGVINVNGPGSQRNTINLTFGGELETLLGGTGQLNIQNGGVVTADNLTQFFTNGSSIIIDGGTLKTPILLSSGGVGTINLLSDPAGGSTLNITAPAFLRANTPVLSRERAVFPSQGPPSRPCRASTR